MPLRMHNNATILLSPQPGLPRVGNASKSAFEKFGTLYKHCKAVHLPQPGQLMRLGTLSEYRRIENNAVRDEHEGTFRVSLAFPDRTPVAIDMIRRATLDTSPLGAGSSINNLRTNVFYGWNTIGSVYSTDNVQIERGAEGEIWITGTVDMHFEGADAYVLCLSTSEEVGSVILDAGYDSTWSIKQGSVLEFAEKLRSGLHSILMNNASQCFMRETIGPMNAPGFSPPPTNEHMAHTVSVEIWDVMYDDRRIDVSSQITGQTVSDVHARLDRSAAIKPTSFSNEREVRLLLRPLAIDRRSGKRYLFPNHLTPVFLPVEPLLSFIE